MQAEFPGKDGAHCVIPLTAKFDEAVANLKNALGIEG